MGFIEELWEAWTQERETRADAEFLAEYIRRLKEGHETGEPAEFDEAIQEVVFNLSIKYDLDCGRTFADIICRIMAIQPGLSGSIEEQKIRLAHFAGETGLTHFETLLLLELADDFLNEDDFHSLRNMECASDYIN